MRKEAENNEQAACADAMTEIERILASRTFHGRETMQRLLSYLAKRTMDGSAEFLKEYTIGVDVFGKSADYDPQEDASVRVQIGRLRQKLEEYSRAEGVNDPVLIELPKRQYALLAHSRNHPQVSSPDGEKNSGEVDSPDARVPVPAMRSLPMPSWPSFLLGALIATIVWAGWSFRRMEPKTEFRSSPELDELWRPFLSSERPVTMAMTMRPFLRYDRGVVWEWGLTELPDSEKEPHLAELQRRLDTRILTPWEKTYTSFGEATGVFLLTRLFESHRRDVELKRNDSLSWEEIAEQNVIFIGAGKYGVPFDRIPVHWAFEQKGLDIINLYPKNGEPSLFTTTRPLPPNFLQTDDYALISLAPGLHGKGDVLAFGASSSSGLWAAAQYMTDPQYARDLLSKLKGPGGSIPRHYQVVVHARFQSLVPVEIKYITHRELD